MSENPYHTVCWNDTLRAMSVLLANRPEWLEKTLRNTLVGLGYEINQDTEDVFKARRVLQKLRKLPVIEQRSPEWYKMRAGLLTASDFGQAVGKGKFGNRDQLLMKKAKLGMDGESSGGSSLSGAPQLKWGIMYEPVAQKCYQKIYGGIPIYEFGLIQHPTFPIVGASPDGINGLGTMIEIKCPYARKIVPGEIPEQYALQIQGQLEVCNLEKCDYIECEFKECDLDELPENMYKGVVYECYSSKGDVSPYIYSPVFESATELSAWDKEAGMKYEQSIMRRHFWYLDKVQILEVKRDRKVFAELRPKIEEFWSQVLHMRENKEELEKMEQSKKPRVSKKVVNDTFAFVDDE